MYALSSSNRAGGRARGRLRWSAAALLATALVTVAPAAWGPAHGQTAPSDAGGGSSGGGGGGGSSSTPPSGDPATSNLPSAPSGGQQSPPPPSLVLPPTAVILSVPPGGGTVSFAVPGGQQGTVTISAALTSLLPPNTQLQVAFDPVPTTLNDVERGSLGGGNVVPHGGPVSLTLRVVDASGQPVPTPPALLQAPITVTLPVLQHPTDPSHQFAWLVEMRDASGFLGYMRRDGQFDPATNSLRYGLTVGEVLGTRFLPSMIVPAWVRNHDANVHIWSSPLRDAVGFGVAAPQFTLFRVVGPQVGFRIFVLNPATGNYGWIDASGVGPSGP